MTRAIDNRSNLARGKFPSRMVVSLLMVLPMQRDRTHIPTLASAAEYFQSIAPVYLPQRSSLSTNAPEERFGIQIYGDA